MVDLDAGFGQEFLEISVGKSVPRVPAHREEDHLGRELESGEGWAGLADQPIRATTLHPVSLADGNRRSQHTHESRRCNRALELSIA